MAEADQAERPHHQGGDLEEDAPAEHVDDHPAHQVGEEGGRVEDRDQQAGLEVAQAQFLLDEGEQDQEGRGHQMRAAMADADQKHGRLGPRRQAGHVGDEGHVPQPPPSSLSLSSVPVGAGLAVWAR